MSLKTSIAWMALAQAAALALQFASSVVLARHLSAHEMGVFAVALAVVGLVSLFQQLGLPALIVREEHLTDEVRSTAFTVNLLVTAALSLAIAGLGLLGGSFFADDGVRHVLLALAISPLFGVLGFLPASHLERDGRFKRLAAIAIAGNVAGTLATIAFAAAGHGSMSIAYAQIIGSACYAFLAMATNHRAIGHRLSLAAWRRIADFSAQMLAAAGVFQLSQRVAELMMGRLLGLGALGLYNRANGLNSLVWSNLHFVTGKVILVEFADLNRRGVPLRDSYARTVSILSALLWPAYAGLIVIARPFIALVYGERWVAAADAFALLALASMIGVTVAMSWELFTATGRVRAQTRLETIRAVVATAAFLAGCMISLEAAAASRVLDAAVAVALYRREIAAMTGTTLAGLWPVFRRSLALTALAVAPAALLMLATAGVPSAPALLASVLAGAALWLAGLFLLDHELADEIRGALPRHAAQAMR